jgi:hypothetical protein
VVDGGFTIVNPGFCMFPRSSWSILSYIVA